jgi:pyruvate formate lyase activating enzyme
MTPVLSVTREQAASETHTGEPKASEAQPAGAPEKARCPVCPHHCSLSEGGVGFCRARGGEGGKNCLNYGEISSLSLDPIEKKPLKRFRPGSTVLSVGSFGCNLRCPFCQNCEISMKGPGGGQKASPEELANLAQSLKPKGNIGLAYTYNEPLVGFEFVRDCAVEIRARGMQNVLVTNGCFCLEPLNELIPLIDAANVDLKGFTQGYYDWVKGDLDAVKKFIARLSGTCHVEVTTLVVPGKNDTEEEIDQLSSWLKSLGDIPLHLSRCFPRYHFNEAPTPSDKLYALADIARTHLAHVYLGNI